MDHTCKGVKRAKEKVKRSLAALIEEMENTLEYLRYIIVPARTAHDIRIPPNRLRVSPSSYTGSAVGRT